MAPGVTYASDDPNLLTQEELAIFIGDLHHLIAVGNKDSMETHWPIHNFFFSPQKIERETPPCFVC